MSGWVGVIVLVGGLVVVVVAADLFVDGLLAVALALGIAPFVLSVALSGFETENLATGIAANAKGLSGAAAGTFLGGVTFLAFGVAGLGGLIAPIRVELPIRFAVWTAIAPLPLFAFAVDGHLSRLEGGLLVVWAVIALVGLALSGRELLGGDDDDDEHVRFPVLRLLGGLALLTGGGWLIGQGLRTTVRQLGIPQTLLGNTALAAAIEAEELARFAVPARRGRPEIGLGNIAGTVVHFAALNAGIIAIVKPLSLGGDTTRFYLPVAVASPAILAAVLVVRKRLGRIEGAALTGLYVAYVAVAIAITS
ncbi:MAG: sodium:calcium antiporter [Solirubrobacteraceae bacterium]